jgi:hypothetical protein
VSPGSNRLVTVAVVVAAVGAAIGALGRSAAAQPSGQAAAATVQFDRGRALLKEKKYAEACAAFEHSQKLDPQWGTLYNLAGCYARLGKLASAWATYRELAQRDTNPARRKDASKRATELDRRLPRLLLTAASAPAGLTVTLDGIDVTGLVGTENPVDLGSHAIHATAPDRADFDTTAAVTGEGKTVTVAIELAPAARPRAVKPPPRSEPAVAPVAPGSDDARPTAPVARPQRGAEARPRPAPSSEPEAGPSAAPRSPRRVYGVIVAGAGGALVATGLVFGRLASSKWSEARALCGDDRMCDTQADLARGNQLVGDARSRANLSTGFVIGGGAAIGIGAILFATAPRDAPSRSALRLTPGIGGNAVSLALEGRY